MSRVRQKDKNISNQEGRVRRKDSEYYKPQSRVRGRDSNISNQGVGSGGRIKTFQTRKERVRREELGGRIKTF